MHTHSLVCKAAMRYTQPLLQMCAADVEEIPNTGFVWLQQVMKDPVTAADGHTYERGAIVHWMHANGVSPVTHQPLHNKHLTPNTQIKIALNRMKQSERVH